MTDLKVPLPRVRYSLQFVKSKYHGIPVFGGVQNLSGYTSGRESTGNLDELRQVEPAVLFDPARVKTEQD